MEKTKQKPGSIIIDARGTDMPNTIIKTSGCVYIEMGAYTYYFDNSTGEEIIHRWLTNSTEDKVEIPTFK